MLRGSTRGVLLVGQDHYMLGNTVEVRAQLTNARLDPLDVPSVGLQVVQPGGAVQTVAMRADPSRAGAYFGQFPVLQEGTYRLELPVPESENERLEPPHPGESARPGTGEPPPERRPVEHDCQEHRRAILRRHGGGPRRERARPR